MYDDLGKVALGLYKIMDSMARFAVFSLFVAWPLALWQIGEILVWICRHISITWS